ncbi:PREDICTED: uncharacterized protein LOC108770644 [Trachymyrmex cornetzi]|uniref:uncharacterized protein LOC108770644 n=1 Tax=Trachymyrmex cornetzi TaxID=471704 RepID=UPI00084F3478|nr:PREDICTED: uncharacterized protein LOC108770644 [Trachymyrmex cornetzi]
MKRYISSGSGAEAGQKSSFRFYARMQFLEEVMPVTPTTSSLSRNVTSEEKNELNEVNLSIQESSSIIYSPSCSTASIRERSDSSDDWKSSSSGTKSRLIWNN